MVLSGLLSKRLKLKSGVLQGSAICLVLFQMYVHDVNDGNTWKISKFSGNTNIASKVITTLEREALQSDLDRLFSCDNKWQIKFLIGKMQIFPYRMQQRSHSVFNEWPRTLYSKWGKGHRNYNTKWFKTQPALFGGI